MNDTCIPIFFQPDWHLICMHRLRHVDRYECSTGILENCPGPYVSDLPLISVHPHMTLNSWLHDLWSPTSVSDPTSGNLDLVSIIGLTGIRFSALPKKFWSEFCFSPWQVASDSIAHLNPSLLWLGWYPSQTGPGTVMEHYASLRNHDYCTVFISPSALLCVPYR